jgi:hypothetical protein
VYLHEKARHEHIVSQGIPKAHKIQGIDVFLDILYSVLIEDALYPLDLQLT